jgi:hypothetical protein
MRDFEAIGIEMRMLEKAGKWHERNALVPVWREAYHSYDFGFEVGEEVEYYPNPSGKPVIGKILAIHEDNQIVFAGLVISALLVRKIHHELDPQLNPPGPQKLYTREIHSKGDSEHCEQLKLF